MLPSYYPCTIYYRYGTSDNYRAGINKVSVLTVEVNTLTTGYSMRGRLPLLYPYNECLFKGEGLDELLSLVHLLVHDNVILDARADLAEGSEEALETLRGLHRTTELDRLSCIE